MADDATENAISEDDSDDDVPEELKRDYVDEQTGEKPNVLSKSRKDTKKVRNLIIVSKEKIVRFFSF